MKQIIEDKFGFLIKKCNFKFNDVEIICLESYEVDKRIIKANEFEGFYYPLYAETRLHQLPPSHKLLIKSDKSIQELRATDTGFIMHLIGYLFGCRLQFHDWWFDKELPLDRQHNIIFRINEAEDFLGHSFEAWKNLSLEGQKIFTNLLYMHSRNCSYRLEWERFMMEYIVFDGLWEIYEEIRKRKKHVSHSGKIERILGAFNMIIHKDKIKNIVKLRNDLFHKSLWDNKHLGSAQSQDAFYAYYWLKKINQRLVPALLGYKTKYVESSWVSLGTYMFKM